MPTSTSRCLTLRPWQIPALQAGATQIRVPMRKQPPERGPNGGAFVEVVPTLLVSFGFDFRYELDNPVFIACPYPLGTVLVGRETLYLSECGGYLCRGLGSGNFEAWTRDGSVHWQKDDRVKTWEDAAIPRHPLEYGVGGYSAKKTGQKKGSFSLSLLHCDTSKFIEPFKGNTIVEARDIVFRRQLPPQRMPAELSRFHLPVTACRPEQVYKIGHRDIAAEGIELIGNYRARRRELWVADYGPRYPWEKAWCWAITVERK